MAKSPIQKVIVEVEGVVVNIISPREYQVKVTRGEYKDTLVNATLGGSLYYDGIILFKKDAVVLEIRTSTPDKGYITYRL